MNLKQWAAREGVHPLTAYRWFREGKLPVPARRVGRLILVEPDAVTPRPTGRTVVYARVSSGDQRADLDRQVARVTEWVTGDGGRVDQVVTEVGSALNGHRRKFLALLRDPTATRIVVEHHDRCVRFGAEYVEAALAAQGRELVVVDPSEFDSSEVAEDLVRDVTEILTSLCTRVYGRRGAANRAARAVEAITAELFTAGSS